MAAGDVVNTAARLQRAAPVNGILVDETTYRATERAIEYREAEPVEAKGKAEPVPVWEALEARARFGVDVVQAGERRSSAGERELDLLARRARARARGALAAARHARRRARASARAGSSTSSSRVVDATPELITWRQGRSLPYGEGVTFWALARDGEGAGGHPRDRPAGRGRARSCAEPSREPVDRRGRARGSSRRCGRSSGSAPTRTRAATARRALRRLAAASSRRSPSGARTVLVFEDLHWADDDLLDFVDHLVDWADGRAAARRLHGAAGAARAAAGLGRRQAERADALALAALRRRDGAPARARCSSAAVLPAEVQAALLARAGGNPLYAEQFARMLAERGRRRRPARCPRHVQGIIAARLDALPPPEKQLLQDAAVARQGLLARRASRDRRARPRAGEERCTRSSARSSSAASGARRSAARGVRVPPRARPRRGLRRRSRAPRRAEKHEPRREWIEALGRARGPRGAARAPLPRGSGVRRAAGQETAELAERGPGWPARGRRPRLCPRCVHRGRALLRGGARALAAGRSGEVRAAAGLRAQPGGRRGSRRLGVDRGDRGAHGRGQGRGRGRGAGQARRRVAQPGRP